VLLFVVLFYVYPLKFLANIWLAPLTGMPMRISNALGGMRLVMTYGDTRGLLLIFGSGFAALYFVFAALYLHAWRVREALGLSIFEIAHTKISAIAQILNGALGLLSMLVASVLKPEHASDAGYVYLLAAAVGLWRWRSRVLAREPSP
jgi:hypothetical protein